MQNDARDARLQGGAVGLIVLLTVLLHATQWAIDILPGKSNTLNISLADLLIAVAFVIWLTQAIVRRKLSLPPFKLALLGLLWLALSVIPALLAEGAQRGAILRSGMITCCQYAEYFLIAYIIFHEVFHYEYMRRWAVRLLMLAVFISLIFALVQYCRDIPALKVRGAGFTNRNTYGTFLALTIPLIFGVSIFGHSHSRRALTALILLGALLFTLAGGPFLALCFGLLIVAAIRSGGRFVITGIALLLIGFLILPHLSRPNPDILVDSVLLYKSEDPYHTFGDAIPRIQEQQAESRANLMNRIMAEEPVPPGELPSEQENAWKWQERWKEWQAAILAMKAHPLLGVGAGGYQRNINRFYGKLPRHTGTDLMEPDAVSMYMIWGSSAGLPFLIILVGLFLRAAVSAGSALAQNRDCFDRGVAAGLLGSFGALLVAGVFTDPIVRGLGVTLAILLALAHSLHPAPTERTS